ncbi:MAG: phosphodiester glycosidase family protein [Clostridia bacterium]|nr:phosphodiester glycosidase family protein [Clostridia bacterium]
MIRNTIVLFLTLLLITVAGSCQSLPIDLSGGMHPAESAFLSDTMYEDDSLKIEIETIEYKKTNCYVARITIADPSQLRTAPAYAFDRDQTAPADAIAERVNAVLAINGDYFSYQMQSGSYLIRQGTMYLNQPMYRRDVLLIDENGDFTIIKPHKNGEPKEFDPKGEGIVNSFNFGPGMIIDGERMDPEYVGQYNFSQTKHRRCAICQVEHGKLEYVCVVADGPEENKDGGLDLQEFTDFIQTLGVQYAYNLDGGNSTVMLFGGHKINAIDQKYMRPISDIIYFATTVSGDDK